MSRQRDWWERNKERLREKQKLRAAQAYRDDPIWAARKRAKNIISMQTGMPIRLIPAGLVEAKAMQLLVRAAIVRPEAEVGQHLTDSERRERKAASWQRWYAKNKDRRAEYQREYQARKKALDNPAKP